MEVNKTYFLNKRQDETYQFLRTLFELFFDLNQNCF